MNSPFQGDFRIQGGIVVWSLDSLKREDVPRALRALWALRSVLSALNLFPVSMTAGSTSHQFTSRESSMITEYRESIADLCFSPWSLAKKPPNFPKIPVCTFSKTPRKQCCTL